MSISTPMVTVALAAFNVEEFVSQCLDSILAQSYENFELVIVDDGSQDGTRAILHSYAGRDERIRLVLREHNGGLSAARNDAIDCARGEFIIFVDADDLFDPELIELAMVATESSDADLVVWDYVAFTGDLPSTNDRLRPSALLTLGPGARASLLARPAFSWTKMIRCAALRRLSVTFPVGLTYQDVLVHWQLITQIERIAVVPRRLSFYRQQPAATTAGTGLRRADYMLVLDLVEAYLKQSGFYGEYRDQFIQLQLNAWHGVYDVVDPEHKQAVLAMIKARMTPAHEAYVSNRRPLRWRAARFYRALGGSWMSAVALRSWLFVRACHRRLISFR